MTRGGDAVDFGALFLIIVAVTLVALVGSSVVHAWLEVRRSRRSSHHEQTLVVDAPNKHEVTRP